MKQFKGVDLNDSFVLSWQVTDGILCFELEASLWPESAHYESPKEGEHTCYKKAKLCFEGCDLLEGLKEMTEVLPSQDALGDKDYGNIDGLEATEDGYLIVGDFGEVRISKGVMRFEIET